MTKAVFEPHTPHEVAAAAAEALAIATDGRPGPVAVALPEDVTEGETNDAAVPEPRPRRAILAAPDDIRAIAERIAQAERPVAVAGEMVGFEGANEALATFAEAYGVGVLSSFRQQGVVPCAHPSYLGTLGSRSRLIRRICWPRRTSCSRSAPGSTSPQRSMTA